MRHVMQLIVALTLLPLAAAMGSDAAPWHRGLYLDGGGWWPSRVRVRVHNDKPVAVAGEPVAVVVGSEAGQAPLAGAAARSLRVCDAQGTELLFAIEAPDANPVTAGPIPAGSVLVLPATCPPHGAADYYVYFDNAAAWEVPDFLTARTRLINGDVEAGQGDAPAGWQHDAGDDQHRASWSAEAPQSGRRCLKTVVAAGAASTWISTRQRDLRVLGGARYRMTAWVKAQDVRGQAGWYIHVGHHEQPMLISPMLIAGDGTFDWKQVVAEFTAPPDAKLADLGTVLYGTGTAWFDNVRLECLTPGMLRAEASPVERLTLREVGSQAAWPPAGGEKKSVGDRRAAVPILNLGDEPLGPALVAVDLTGLETRARGRLKQVMRDGQVVPHWVFAGQLLFEAHVPARTMHSYYVYCAEDSQPGAAPAPSPSTAVELVQNRSFEMGTDSPTAWTASGADPRQPGVTLGFDTAGRAELGQRCAKLHVPADTPDAWRGWRQDVPVKPGRTYLLAVWIKCQDVRAGEVRVHAHRRTADGQLSAHQPFTSIGPGVTGTADWTLISGQLTMPADTTVLQIHLTMEQTGTVWHDNVVLTEIVPGEVCRIEGRPTAASDPLAVWQVPAVVKVFPDDPAPTSAAPLAIAAARNEQEPLQLAVRSARTISEVQVQVDPPAGPNGFRLDDVRVNVVGYVPIDHPTNYYRSDVPSWQRRIPAERGSCDGWAGLWPDPLLPSAALALRPDVTQPVWITVGVPKQAPAGTYTGRVRLTAAGQTLLERPFDVRVYDFALPDENHVAAIYDVRLGREAAWGGRSLDDLYPDILRFMAARRLCPDTIRPGPVFRREQGRVTADFTAYDRAATLYFDELEFPFAYTPWDFYLFGWGHPPKPLFGEAPYPGQPPYDGVDRRRLRPEYQAVYQEMLRLFWNHLKEKGWHQRIILYISDEPFDHHEHIRTQMKALCAMIHEVDPAIPIYCSTWKHVPAWDGSLDVWGLGHDGRVPTAQMAKLRAAGDRLWFTTDGQMCTDTPSCAVERLLPHYCFHHGVEAYEFWGFAWLTYDPFRFGWHSFIHQSEEPGRSTWVRYPNGDGFLIYPGAALGQPGVVSSIRCEQAREGVEDYEYLYLLNQRIAQATAAGADVTQAEKTLRAAGELVSIPNAGGRFSTKILPDPQAVYRVRERVAAAIESLPPAKPSPEP